MHRRFWAQSELSELRKRYPDEPAQQIAEDLGRPVRGVYGKASELGLSKSQAFIDSDRSGRIQRGRTDPRMMATQFRKGHAPANKGLRRPGWAPGRMAETQFKKGAMAGAAQHNYVPIGSTRITRDGYLERKTTDDPDLYPARRWIAVHRLVWEAANGPVPKGHIVVFKPGMKTTQENGITLEKIECISRAENMRRNTVHRYPEEVVKTIRQISWLNRKIKQKEESA